MKLLPLSIVMLVTAMAAEALEPAIAPPAIVRAGLLALLISIFGLIGSIDYTLNSAAFAISLGLMGFGAGMMVSQIGN